MFSDRFSILVFIRVVLITTMCVLFAFLFARSEFLFSQIIIFTSILILTIELIRFTRNSSRELSRFLFAVKYGDISMNFSRKDLPPEFRDLADAFREMIKMIRDVKIDKEVHYQLLQAIIDRISFGIIAARPGGDILLMNATAADILHMQKVNHWGHIEKKAGQFTGQIEGLSGEGRKLVEFESPDGLVQLSVVMNTIRVQDQNCSILTFHDIRDEIEQKEIEAWYKLIRILTHEIMNSVTPLSSLTDTMLMLTEDARGVQKSPDDITDSIIGDIRSSVKTIKSRSAGILQFVDAYRKLTNIPLADFSIVKIEDFVHPAVNLLRPELQKKNIKIEIRISPASQFLRADKNLMEQVMINLISNSIYALKDADQPHILITSDSVNSRTQVSIIDNGSGIDPSKLDKIFIPFYSTREGGSGIGLSFSKQVIHMHHGRIRVSSTPGKGTTFILEFPVTGI